MADSVPEGWALRSVLIPVLRRGRTAQEVWCSSGGWLRYFSAQTEAGAALVVDKLGLVSFEDLDGRGDLVSVGGDDDAVDGT